MESTPDNPFAAPLRPAGPLVEPAAPRVLPLAPLWRRVGAFAFDVVILAVVYAAWMALGLVLSLPFSALTGAGRAASLLVGALFALGFLAIVVSYFTVLECSPEAGSFGKQAFGLRVTDVEGRPVRFGQALARTLLMIATVLMCYGLGALWALGNARRQALHDRVARTVVLHERWDDDYGDP